MYFGVYWRGSEGSIIFEFEVKENENEFLDLKLLG